MDEERKKRGKNRHAAESKGIGILGKILLFLIFFIIIVVIVFFAWYNISLSATGTEEEKVTFQIDMGSGTSKIASILKEKDLIRSEEAFKIYVKLNNVTNFQAGNYTLSKDMSVKEIADSLKNGIVFKDSTYNITFVEGKTFKYIAKTIAENTNNTEQDVYDLVSDEAYLDSIINEYWFITDEIKNTNIYCPLEGYLFPDTYAFDDKNVSVREIFKTMLDQMGVVLNKYKSSIQNGNHTVHEILSMASIIETEAIQDKDRKNVASVFYNRLEANMSLGSDVTTYYAFKIDLGSRDLYKSEITTYNPYNTRGPKMEGKITVRTNCVSRKSFYRSCNISK